MKRILYICMALVLGSCLKDEPFKNEFSGFEPTQLNDGWQVSTPEAENISRDKLTEAYRLLHNDERFLMARSMIVIRNGMLVAEDYPHDAADRDRFQNIQSCTKTFTSMMVGVAIANGVQISTDDKLYDRYPQFFDDDPVKRGITLGDALTMQTGLEFDNSTNTLHLYQEKGSSVEYVLSFRSLYQPGTVMNYNDGAPQLVSKAIEVATGVTEAGYARRYLFDPLEITEWKWESAHDGTTFGAFSLFLKPRDFARAGQLLLQNGNWQGQQLIDSIYLKEAISHHVTTKEGKKYGYYFWLDDKNQAYYAHGHGGQVLMVVPSKNLVLLYTAWPYTSGDFFDDAIEMFQLIIDGCH